MKEGLKVVVFFSILLGLCSWGFGAEVELIGAGATFPYPLYSKMFDVYHKETRGKDQLSGDRFGRRDSTAYE